MSEAGAMQGRRDEVAGPQSGAPSERWAQSGAPSEKSDIEQSGTAMEPASPASAASARAGSLPVRWRRLGGADDPVPEGRTPRAVDRGRRIGIALAHALYRMDIRGSEHFPPSGPVVVVANHCAFIDGPVLFGNLPRRISFLVKAEAVRGPLGWLLRTVGQYAINRAAPERQVLMAALAQLKAGGVIGIFPEGARGAGDVASVFNGAGWLAVRSGSSVVPVAMRGTARPAGRRARRLHPLVRMRVGEPFAIPVGSGRAAINSATNTIQRQLSRLVAELDAEIADAAGRPAPRRRRRRSR